MRIGRPVLASVLNEHAAGNRRLMVDGLGLAIAELLPPDYRGAYRDDAPRDDGAHQLFLQVFGEGAG